MKKLLFVLLVSFVAIGCGKDTEPATSNPTIIGKWNSGILIKTYYNAAGTQVLIETTNTTAIWDFTVANLTYTSGANSEQTTYNLVSNNRLELGPNTKISEVNNFSILQLDANNMVLEGEKTGSFGYSENNTIKEAVRIVIKIYFKK